MLDDRRLGILAALGIDVYRLRAAEAEAPPAQQPVTASAAAGVPNDRSAVAPAVDGDENAAAEGQPAEPALVLACAPGARRDARAAASLARILRAIGSSDAAAAWVEVGAGTPARAVPLAAAYLMVGADAARACSALLPLAVQDAAAIAVIADPAVAAADAAAKRALWQSLKPLARRLRAAAE